MAKRRTSSYSKEELATMRENTIQKINQHPLNMNVLKEAVLEAWQDILETKIGNELKIGVDIFPKPQIMGFFLHELIPIKVSKKDTNWTIDKAKTDKDLVCLSNPYFSVEIKTSSSNGRIFGNRSYGKGQDGDEESRVKGKSGYYLAVNFEKFQEGSNTPPSITKIRFGWLDHTDWISQAAESGQNAHLDIGVENNKLLEIFPNNFSSTDV